MAVKYIKGLLILILLGVGMVPSLAQSDPQITTFSTNFTEVGRSALGARTARIPVTWSSINRPLTANLVFEQILPNGSLINVELPRVIPWVNSSGDGIAAPILPDGEVSSITLRVSLVSLFNDTIYDTRELILPIVSGDSGGNGSGSVPAITRFVQDYAAPLNRTELNSGNLRLPVTWQAINRPTWMNLVFEQVLPDGTVQNVELPRNNPWVNSADRGVVAPVSVGDAAQDLVLRIRLVSFYDDRTYDQVYTYVPIQSSQNQPDIANFSSNIGSISSDGVVSGSLIQVDWSVINRPNGSNLLFEQILPDGTVQNVELPRDNPIVSSYGSGLIDPVLPSQTVDELVFQLRLVDLSNNSTLDSRTLRITLNDVAQDGDLVVVEGDACYQDPFEPDNGITNGAEVRVQVFNDGQDLQARNQLESYTDSVVLSAGDTAIVESDPYCSYVENQPETARRQWFVDAGADEGWIYEYQVINGQAVQFVVPSNQADIPIVTIDSLSLSPDTVDIDAVDSTDFTFSWQTSNALNVSLSPIFTNNTLLDGSTTVSGSTFGEISNEQPFTLIARDTQNNVIQEEVILTLTGGSAPDISEFTANRTEVPSTESIIFDWEITGSFVTAELSYTDGENETQLLEVVANTGTLEHIIAPSVPSGEKTAILTVTDTDGREQTQSITFSVTCDNSWQISTNDPYCPEPALTSSGAYQTFERGFMLWAPVSNQDQVILSFFNDGTAMRNLDQWDGADYIIDGTPPEGLFAPERGFGYTWNTIPEIRSGLGWAAASEQSFNITAQTRIQAVSDDEEITYYTLPDGRIVRMTSSGGTNPNYTWAFDS